MMKLSEQIDVEYDKAEALSGRCDIPRDTLFGWKILGSRLETTNAALLDVVKDCVNFLADLKTKPFYIPGHLSDRAKALHKRAYTAHSKAKEK